MNNGFWSDFLASFLSDFLVGVLVGGFLTWRVGKWLSKFETRQQRREKRRGELRKAIRYLELLKEETNYLLQRLPDVIDSFDETGWGREFSLPTPLWDALQPSGELPRLLDPELLAPLTRFYDHLGRAKRGRNLVTDGWLVPQPSTVPGMKQKLDAFVEMTSHALKQAHQCGKGLPDRLTSEIENLKAELETV
jgi:hypothetical protein